MYYKKKNKKKKKYIILFSILILAILFVLVNIGNEYVKGSIIDKGIQDISLIFNNLFNGKTDKKKINDEEYKTLLKKVDALEKTNNDLKKQLNIDKTLTDYDYITGTVINRDLNYWYDSITINKGTKDLINPDYAVTYKGYLIGKITKVTKHNSTIRLLTSNGTKNKVSVKIKTGDDYVYGLLSNYSKDTNYYTVNGISSNQKIDIDSICYTTGFSDIFPSLIEIGKVKKIENDNFGLSYIIYVEPSINVDDIDYVTVLKRK